MKVQTTFGLPCTTRGYQHRSLVLPFWAFTFSTGNKNSAILALRRWFTLPHFTVADSMCKTDRWTGESSLHFPTYKPYSGFQCNCVECGRECTGGEKCLSKHAISLRTGSSHWFHCLVFLFPRCTHIYTTCFSAILKQGCGSAERHGLSPNNPGSLPLIVVWDWLVPVKWDQPKPQMSANSLQVMGKQAENSTQDYFLWCALHGRERRQPLCKGAPAEESIQSVTQQEQWLLRGAHYLSYDIWDGCTSY